MDLVTLIKAIPPTFWGIIVGSLFTVVGVVLTNASNTRRLRIQHEHERDLEKRERDLAMRRDIYLEAMEALSAGMVVVGRFGDLDVKPNHLMQSYMDKSPAIARVNIVGNRETIEAVSGFNLELIGTFLRLEAKRERVNALHRHCLAIEGEIESVSKEQHRLKALLEMNDPARAHDERPTNAVRRDLESAQQRLVELRTQDAEILDQLFSGQMKLVQSCVAEQAALDRLLIPIIRTIRAELGLAFDEAHHLQIVEAGHKKLAGYLERFACDLAPEIGSDHSETDCNTT